MTTPSIPAHLAGNSLACHVCGKAWHGWQCDAESQPRPAQDADSPTAPEIAAKAFEEVERQTPRCSRCSATHAGSAGGLTSTWRTSGIGAAWKCIDIVACSSRRIIDPVEAKPAADTTQHALQQLCPSCQHFNPWRNCGDAFHGLPSPFDPNPPPKAPAIDGWIHCPKCRTVVSAVAHECGRKMPADFDALVSHWTEEYERVEGRAEFAESLLCAMAFDSARNAYDGGTCSAQLLRHHEDECVFCDASRAVRHSCQVTP